MHLHLHVHVHVHVWLHMCSYMLVTIAYDKNSVVRRLKTFSY